MQRRPPCRETAVGRAGYGWLAGGSGRGIRRWAADGGRGCGQPAVARIDSSGAIEGARCRDRATCRQGRQGGEGNKAVELRLWRPMARRAQRASGGLAHRYFVRLCVLCNLIVLHAELFARCKCGRWGSEYQIFWCERRAQTSEVPSVGPSKPADFLLCRLFNTVKHVLRIGLNERKSHHRRTVLISWA